MSPTVANFFPYSDIDMHRSFPILDDMSVQESVGDDNPSMAGLNASAMKRTMATSGTNLGIRISPQSYGRESTDGTELDRVFPHLAAFERDFPEVRTDCTFYCFPKYNHSFI